MKIETKLTLNNIQKNIKRTTFTTISIMLCTVLIFITVLLISSVRNGISENIETEYNDYHFILKDLSVENFNKIKNKEYIDKIYIQKDNKQLEKIEKPYILNTQNNINVYIKYKNINKMCNYTTDVIQTLNLANIESKCEFNQKLLTIYGLIDVGITGQNYSYTCTARVNYSYVLNIMIILILVAFSILFIIILHNAFLITINERKKEYAILNSVGGTEGQILKMMFLETIIMGLVGIVIGGLISYLGANIILKILNNILVDLGYKFRLIFDAKYIALSLFIIILNIYIATLIPSIKASTTSIIQGIRNNKQIKYKKRNSILEKILPIEGKLAIKNIKRNKNKYRVITILLVVCITSYIAVSTYISYEKEASKLISQYDVDALLRVSPTINIESIINDYETKYKNKIEYIKHKNIGAYVLVEPENVIITDYLLTTYEDNKKSMPMMIIGLDDKTYNNYIKKLNANYGDLILYNRITKISGIEKSTYAYYPALKTGEDFKLAVIAYSEDYENGINEYTIIDDENLNGNFILTDELIDGFNELKTKYHSSAVFVNMDTYNKIEEKFNNYTFNKKYIVKWLEGMDDTISVKIRCNNVIQFSNYIEDVVKKQNIEIDAQYFSLENQEKIIYINIIQLILRVIILAIITIGIISTINITNASLAEREQDFKILYSLGATKANINKILIYESIYMFIKATIISIILLIPIIYGIVKYIENTIILNKLLIPYGNIFIFLTIILLVSLLITLYSTKMIKDK